MKKILSAILPLYLLAVPMTVSADEGMWTLYNLPQAVYEQMMAEGFTMPYADLYESPSLHEPSLRFRVHP